LIEQLTEAVDPKNRQHPIKQVFDVQRIYRGPYVRNAPDLIVGYYRGYRVSWDLVVGKMADETLFDNPRPWAADHCMAPTEVPGVLFSNQPIENKDVWIGDVAPTVLGLFGLEVPGYMDGQQLQLRLNQSKVE